MQKSQFINLSNTIIQILSTNPTFKKRVVNETARISNLGLQQDYQTYQDFCSSFYSQLPQNLKNQIGIYFQLPSNSKGSKSLNSIKSGLTPNTQTVSEAITSQVYHDKRFIVSLIFSCPYSSNTTTDYFIEQAFQKLVTNKAFYLPISLQKSLDQNFNQKFRVLKANNAGFELEVENDNQAKKQIIFRVADTQAYLQSLRDLELFMNQNNVFQQNLDLAIQIVEQILNQQNPDIQRGNQTNQIRIHDDLYQIDIQARQYFLHQIDATSQKIQNSIVFHSPEGLFQKTQDLATNSNSNLNYELQFTDLQEPNSKVQTESQSLSSVATPTNQNPISPTSNFDSNLSSSLGSLSQSLTNQEVAPTSSTASLETSEQVQDQSPTALSLASSLVPGIRRLPVAQMSNQPSQNSKSFTTQLSNFYNNNKRGIYPAIGALSGLVTLFLV